ncbi:MAG TPA: T9SS type A sorting domain-containing protein [Chitinophagaceae bacterium]
MKTIFIRTAILPFLILCLSTLAFAVHAQELSSFRITNFKIEEKNGDVGLSWKTESEKDLRQFEIESSTDGNYYQNLGFIPATNNINGNFYEFENAVAYDDSVFYRLKVVDRAGQWIYTQPLLYYTHKLVSQFVYPSVITTHMMNIFVNDPFYSLEVVSMSGTVMLKQNLSGQTGRINVPLSPELSAGTYIVQLKNYDKTITQKVIVQ